MPTLSEMAARLVSLLNEIGATENLRQNAPTDAYGMKISFVGEPVAQSELDAEKKLGEEFDKRYQKILSQQKTQQNELGELAKSLASEARKLGAVWQPLMRLSANWNLAEDLNEAKASAALLDALISPPPTKGHKVTLYTPNNPPIETTSDKLPPSRVIRPGGPGRMGIRGPTLNQHAEHIAKLPKNEHLKCITDLAENGWIQRDEVPLLERLVNVLDQPGDPSSEETRADKNIAQKYPHGDPKRKGTQYIKASHAYWLVGVVVGAAWIIPGVAESWNHWWMKLIVYLFGFACGVLIFAVLFDWAEWKPLYAAMPACFVWLSYTAVVFFASSGGVMPIFLSSPRMRFVLPVVLTALAMVSWFRALRPVPSAKSIAGNPEVVPPPHENPTTAASQISMSDAPHGWRSLTQDQRDEFIRILKDVPKKGPVSVVYNHPDEETYNYVNQLRSMLDAAGFTAPAGKSRMAFYQAAVIQKTGDAAGADLILFTITDQNVPSYAYSLKTAIKEIGLKLFVSIAPANPPTLVPGDLVLFVETKSQQPSTPITQPATQSTSQPTSEAAPEPKNHPTAAKPIAMLRTSPPEIEPIAYAVFGEGPLEEREQWRDTTKDGEPLFVRVKYLICQFEPVSINARNLQLDEDFLHGTPKKLILFFRGGKKVSLKEGEDLTLDKIFPKLPIGKDNPGQTFEVICQQLGPWTKGFRFTELDFRIANPALPPNPGIDAAENANIYYKKVLDGHLRNGAIRIVS
ncbi:MAG: hypothetical protein ABSH08_17025 [Tepidisphaeraceae bacterium]